MDAVPLQTHITSAIVLTGRGPDKVSLTTQFPCPFIFAALPSQPALDFMFDATAGTGVEYVRRHFGIEPKVINTR